MGIDIPGVDTSFYSGWHNTTKDNLVIDSEENSSDLKNQGIYFKGIGWVSKGESQVFDLERRK
ncbi:MAG: hypothetical protein R2827_15700 [Bdellovibrionales bacterium]